MLGGRTDMGQGAVTACPAGQHAFASTTCVNAARTVENSHDRVERKAGEL